MDDALQQLIGFGTMLALGLYIVGRATRTNADPGNGGGYKMAFQFRTGTQTFGAMFPNPAVPRYME